jgi:chaperonin GroEL
LILGILHQHLLPMRETALLIMRTLLFLVTDEKIEYVDQILPTLELAARENRPLLFVATDVENQALAALIMNTVRGSLKVAAVKAPRYGEERRNIMKDLCTSIGATYITRENSLQLKRHSIKTFWKL